MIHYNFRKDIENGKKAEEEAKERIMMYFKDIETINSYEKKEYDLEVKTKTETLYIEVKHDIMAQKTGNVAIEYESRGKPSGLSTTKADYWIYKFHDEFYIFKTDDLRKKIFIDKDFKRDVTGGDKGSKTKMYLVECDKFREWGKKI